MTNPYEVLFQKMSNIESILIQIQKHNKPSKSAPPDIDDPLLTVDETALVTRTPKPTIYRKADQIGYIRHGKRILFRKSDVLKFLEANRKKGRVELHDHVVDNLKRVTA
jgi:excisionase family DNA binding protein